MLIRRKSGYFEVTNINGFNFENYVTVLLFCQKFSDLSQHFKGESHKPRGGMASWLRRGLTYSQSWVRATPGHISLCLQISLISAPSCRVPCPDGIKLQSLGNVRFRNWRRELGNDYRNDQL